MEKQELHEKIAFNCRRVRRKKGMTLRSFDGLTYQCVWKVEHPKVGSNVSLYSIYKVAENLGCTIDDLINGTPDDILKKSQA